MTVPHPAGGQPQALTEPWQDVIELGARERTRIVCVYGLSGQVRGTARTSYFLSGVYSFGRFASHFKTAERLLPAPVLIAGDVDLELPTRTEALCPVRVVLFVTPRGDATLVLDTEVRGDSDIKLVADLLEITCLKREQLRVAGTLLIDWLRQRPEAAGLEFPDDLTLGRNVHQCVFPGGSLRGSIIGDAPLWRLIYRKGVSAEPPKELGITWPDGLQYPGFTVVAHGRGVSVITGFAPFVENTYALVAVMLITGLTVLHRSRISLFDVMRGAEADTSPARNVIADLSVELNKLQLDLEFGVETYLDPVLIPDFIIETYQQSLCAALALPSSLDHSSRMLERLALVIQARQSALDATLRDQADRKDKVFGTLLSLGTVFALPPALLMAFFAIEPATRRSLLHPWVHWGAYLIAFVPFITLIALGWLLRHRIRTRDD